VSPVSPVSIWQNIVPSYRLPPCTPVPSSCLSSNNFKPWQKIFSKLNSEEGQSKRKTVKHTRSQDSHESLDCLHFAMILFRSSSETTIPILTVFLFSWPQLYTFKLRGTKLKAWHQKGWSSRHVHKFLGIIPVCLVRLKYAHKCLEILLVCLDLSRHVQRWLEILKHLWVHPSISANVQLWLDASKMSDVKPGRLLRTYSRQNVDSHWWGRSSHEMILANCWLSNLIDFELIGQSIIAAPRLAANTRLDTEVVCVSFHRCDCHSFGWIDRLILDPD